MPDPTNRDAPKDKASEPPDPLAPVFEAAQNPARPLSRLERLNAALHRLNMKAATMLASLRPRDKNNKH